MIFLRAVFSGFAVFAVLMPRRLRFKELSSNTLGLTWKEPKGAFDSYRLLYSTDSGEKSRLFPSFVICDHWTAAKNAGNGNPSIQGL